MSHVTNQLFSPFELIATRLFSLVEKYEIDNRAEDQGYECL